MIFINDDQVVTSWRGYKYKSKSFVRYTLGLDPPNYPLPSTILVENPTSLYVLGWSDADWNAAMEYEDLIWGCPE